MRIIFSSRYRYVKFVTNSKIQYSVSVYHQMFGKRFTRYQLVILFRTMRKWRCVSLLSGKQGYLFSVIWRDLGNNWWKIGRKRGNWKAIYHRLGRPWMTKEGDVRGCVFCLESCWPGSARYRSWGTGQDISRVYIPLWGWRRTQIRQNVSLWPTFMVIDGSAGFF